jgi:hypothetical protein
MRETVNSGHNLTSGASKQTEVVQSSATKEAGASARKTPAPGPNRSLLHRQYVRIGRNLDYPDRIGGHRALAQQSSRSERRVSVEANFERCGNDQIMVISHFDVLFQDGLPLRRDGAEASGAISPAFATGGWRG